MTKYHNRLELRQKLETIMNLPEWKVKGEKEGCLMCKLSSSSSYFTAPSSNGDASSSSSASTSMIMTKGEYVFAEYTVTQVLDALSDYELRKTYDVQYLSGSLVEQLDEDSEIERF
eukprot:EC849231.1.p1 GENE.EC849231.1~~EC849231.1.p1  ORF type:complete len:116 (+),score=26.15 EC849231.1:30-377(+)